MQTADGSGPEILDDWDKIGLRLTRSSLPLTQHPPEFNNGYVSILFKSLYHHILTSSHPVEISASSAWPSWYSHFTVPSFSDLSYTDVRAKISFLI
jgi:hypothetical protein